MTWVAVAIGGGSALGAGASILGSSMGANAQTDSSEDALKLQRAMFQFQKRQLLEEQARQGPFIAAALERTQFGNAQLPTIQDRLDNPTLSPGFALASKEGLDTLRSNFSASGSPSSGPAQIAGGRFMEDITNNELNRFNENLYRAAGFQGQAPPDKGVSIMNNMSGTTNAMSDILQGQGAVKGGLYSSTGNTLAQLPYLWELMKMNKQQPTTPTATPGFGGQTPDMSGFGNWYTPPQY